MVRATRVEIQTAVGNDRGARSRTNSRRSIKEGARKTAGPIPKTKPPDDGIWLTFVPLKKGFQGCCCSAALHPFDPLWRLQHLQYKAGRQNLQNKDETQKSSICSHFIKIPIEGDTRVCTEGGTFWSHSSNKNYSEERSDPQQYTFG